MRKKRHVTALLLTGAGLLAIGWAVSHPRPAGFRAAGTRRNRGPTPRSVVRRSTGVGKPSPNARAAALSSARTRNPVGPFRPGPIPRETVFWPWNPSKEAVLRWGSKSYVIYHAWLYFWPHGKRINRTWCTEEKVCLPRYIYHTKFNPAWVVGQARLEYVGSGRSPRSFKVELAPSGHVPIALPIIAPTITVPTPTGNALTTYSYGGISFQYPASWNTTPESGQRYIYQVQGPGGASTLSFHVYDQSDRSPSSPLWFLGKFRVLPDDAKTWSNGDGGIDYQATSEDGGDVTVGVVQPIPSGDPGTAFNLSIEVVPSRVNYAWTLLNTWRFGAAANRATLTGSTNQYGDPAFKVTLVGPAGAVTTTAVLDTGNEGPVLINPRLANAIGLQKTGTHTSCGVNGCAPEPTYSGLSVAPAGSSNWMVARGSAIGWKLSGIDLGTDFLKYATETDSDGHWAITWTVQ